MTAPGVGADEITIERASPVHAPAMAALWHAHLAQTRDEVDASFTPALTPAQTAQRWAQAIGSGELLAWIALAHAPAAGGDATTPRDTAALPGLRAPSAGARLAGYLTAKVLAHDPLFADTFEYAPVLYLVDVDVDEAYRGRALARRLLAAAEQHARARGIRALELAAVARDARAVEVWRKAGFEARSVVMRRAVTGD